MMVLYSPDWTNTGFSFILLTVNPFRHSTLTEHGLYLPNMSIVVLRVHVYNLVNPNYLDLHGLIYG